MIKQFLLSYELQIDWLECSDDEFAMINARECSSQLFLFRECAKFVSGEYRLREFRCFETRHDTILHAYLRLGPCEYPIRN